MADGPSFFCLYCMQIKLFHYPIPLFFYTEQLHFENKIGERFNGTSVG